MESLSGKVAVVTGGGSGIGRGIALGLGAAGMTVAVADLHADSARRVAEEVAKTGARAFPVEVDVTSVDSLAQAAREIVREAGGVNVLCANAGVLARIGPSVEHTIEDWEYTFSVNVFGIVKTVEAFRPALLESAPDAHIVNTASLGGLIATEGFPISAYIASKYACVGYSEMLRDELAGQGVGVSVLCPGMVVSDLMGTSVRNRPDHFGGKADAPSAPDGAGAPPPDSMIAAEEVGPIVVDAILANRFHVLTHPAARPIVEARFRRIMDDFDHAARRDGSA